ncbi:glycosyltransferase family 2 protein [Herbaspirillum seropedicae]|uniref:glycosyltransferase family 2 protein n=1 Tax=Herbaspirillum seropedicae TaxID=964 RepID=UPI003D97FF88
MLLTIAIPTYNRAARLRTTLLKHIEQIERAALTDVEIAVSDNCSTDDTQQVCRNLAQAHPDLQLRYFRNDSNIGFDGNVNALFGHARGRYVWTFSDDDDISPQALPHVIDLLRQRGISFAFINYQVNVDGKIMPSRFGAGPDRWLPSRDLLKSIHFSNSLISACIFSRQAWLDANPNRYLGSLWIHFFMAREILQSGESLIVGQPMFNMIQSGLEQSRSEKRREGSDHIEYYMQAHLKFVEYADELPKFQFDRETWTLAQSIGLREDIYQVINFKLTAPSYAPRQLVKIWLGLLKYRWSTVRFWCLTTPLLLAPNNSVKAMRTLSRLIRA